MSLSCHMLSGTGGMLIVRGDRYPVTLDTGAETTVVCRSALGLWGLRGEQMAAPFWRVTGLMVGSRHLPPLPCILTEQRHGERDSVFETAPVLIGMNVLTRLPQPMGIDYRRRVVTFGASPRMGRSIRVFWTTPRGGLGDRQRRKSAGETADFLSVVLHVKGGAGQRTRTKPFVLDTGACCVIDNSGEAAGAAGGGRTVRMSNYEGESLRSSQKGRHVSLTACDEEACAEKGGRVQVRYSQDGQGNPKALDKENFLGNDGIRMLSRAIGDGSLYLWMKPEPAAVIGADAAL